MICRRQYHLYKINNKLRGFTLIELVVSLSIMSIILLGIGSSILIARRAMPDAKSPAQEVITAAQAAEQIASELQYAYFFATHTSREIQFYVADRDGNGTIESIYYYWSGTPGDPLIRQYNDKPAVNVIDSVENFNLEYNLDTTIEETATENESGETLLSSFYTNEDQKSYSVKDNRWYGQYFYPTLPADTISWKVTRIQFYAKISGILFTGECRVQLQQATAGGYPTSIVLEEKTLLESTLFITYTLQEFNFTNASGLSPDRGLCLVFEWVNGQEACDILGSDGYTGPNSRKLLRSDNEGLSWSELSGNCFLYWVYGTVTTAGEPQVNEIYKLATVNIQLQTSSDTQSLIQTTTKLLNKPEITE
jgi:prepilin-type N-terminal cleavage/methylation domain-containing protein